MLRRRSRWRLLFLVLALAGATPRAEANQILLDRLSFNSVTSGRTDIDFENLVGTPAYPQNYPGGPGHYNFLPTGLTVGGVQFVGFGSFGYETYILGPGVAPLYLMGSTFNLLGGRTITDITLPSGVTAFGADFGLDNATAGTLALTVSLRSGATYSSLLSVSQRTQFFGFVGDEIDHIQLDSGIGGFYPYTLLDDVVLARTVPLPDSLMLLVGGLIGLGLVRCRTRAY